MDLINKKNIAVFQIGEDADEIPRALNGGAGSNRDLAMHFTRYDMRQGCLSKSGRT